MDDVWSEQNTKPSRIEAAMRNLLAERHRSNAAFVPSRVINLVVVVDAEYRGEIENRLERVGRYHASRLVICAVSPRRSGIDAVARLSSDNDDPKPGSFALLREKIEIELGARHCESLDSVVDPLMVTDVATVVWAPHGHAKAVDAMRKLAQVVLTDSMSEPTVPAALKRASDLAENLHVVDLSWLRSTPWRERVAAAFDPPQWRQRLTQISSVTVHHRDDSQAAAVLFCGWLASRLAWRPESLTASGDRMVGSARARRGEVRLKLEPLGDMSSPGLAGVTIETAAGEVISLDRSRGGLKSYRRFRDGSEREWTVLGASRGEGGILGEGVRQALLRDRNYPPALAAARAMVSS